MKEFLAALHTEIDLSVEQSVFTTIDTIFLGGGTPSLLDPDDLDDILSHLRTVCSVHPFAEITLEANPETVDLKKLTRFRAAGVNRLSIGIQSFHNGELQFLGRIHDARRADEAFSEARKAGFDNINIDLIYALPGQTMERWRATLEHAIDLRPEHISAYGLIVEENTPLSRQVKARQISPEPVEREAELFEFTMERIGESGFDHYEISNYARPGYRSRHNLNYWNHGSYVGFGPSAHSFTRAMHARGRRWWNVANISDYIRQLKERKLPIASSENLSNSHIMTERLFLGLRSSGLDLQGFRNEFGDTLLGRHEVMIRKLVEENIATLDDGFLKLTPRGFLICDEVSARLLR
jgi:oxygen-independent coproporphyrinogen-3 oxidase